MNDAKTSEADRSVVAILAFAGREFDRVRDLLVRDDEPDQTGVAQNVADDKDADEKDRGLAMTVLSTAGKVAGRVVGGSVHPRADNWATASVDDRIDWWVGRFGTAAAALAAVPGLGGKVGKLVGIDDIIGASAQVLVVNAVAREMGVTDLGQRVSAAARIVLGYEVDPATLGAAVDDPEAQPEPDAPGESVEEKKSPLAWAGRTAQLIWRVARRIQKVRGDLDNRQKGGMVARAISNLPGVGALGLFVTEKSGISKAAAQARDAFSS